MRKAFRKLSENTSNANPSEPQNDLAALKAEADKLEADLAAVTEATPATPKPLTPAEQDVREQLMKQWPTWDWETR